MVLSDFEKQYFKLKVVDGEIKVAFVCDLLLSEYNQLVQTCVDEINKEIDIASPTLGKDARNRIIDARMAGKYKPILEAKMNEIRQTRKSEQR